jgi:pimeloyl-ACP methyl ester carboxylesterase
MGSGVESFEIELAVRAGVPCGRRVIRGRVHGLDPAGRARPFVLLAHGYLTFMDWGFHPPLVESLVTAGIAVVSFNFSGSGVGPDLDDFTDPTGFAHNTYEQELEDLDAVADQAFGGRLGPLDPTQAGLWGHSRGSAMAVLHAARRQRRGAPGYRALCTWASAAHVGRYDPARLEQWRRDGHLWVQLADDRRLRLERDLLDDFEARPARLDVLAAAAELQVPTLLVQGARDRAVSAAEVARLLAAYPRGRARLEQVDGAGHNFGAKHPLREVRPPLAEALRLTQSHFAQHLTGRRS